MKINNNVRRVRKASRGIGRLFRSLPSVIPDHVVRPLLANLRSGFRTAFFLRADAKSWVVSPGQLVLVFLAATVCTIALNRAFFSGAVEFNWSGLRDVSFGLSIVLLVGWLVSHFAARRSNALAIPVALLATFVTMTIVLNGTLHVVSQIGPRPRYWIWTALYWGYFGWLILVAAVLIRRTAQLAPRRLILVVTPLVLLSAYDIFVPPQPLWYQMPAAGEEYWSERDSPASEEILYLQPRLTQESIKRLAPQRRGVPEFYFVGFAPYARENVFLKESEVIRTLMDERFDTEGRSLLLVNNNKTLRQYPLATVTNLRAALQRIGKVIDKDEDVLVLYLTSHGSQTHKLAVSYWPLRLKELDPALLKEILDESGIRWRVIVVSACYAGGFIEPLRGPTTLVMTAADATNTSFGCGSASDFTYFAKALFDEQLRQTYSFEDAFTRAVPVIKEREQALRETFSNPQMAAGDEIRPKLEQIARRLERAHPSVAAR